jgi:hypothetical protein
MTWQAPARQSRVRSLRHLAQGPGAGYPGKTRSYRGSEAAWHAMGWRENDGSPANRPGSRGMGLGEGKSPGRVVIGRPGREGRDPIRVVVSSRAADPLLTCTNPTDFVGNCQGGWAMCFGLCAMGALIAIAAAPPAHDRLPPHARRGERTPSQISASTHRIITVVIGVSSPGRGPWPRSTLRDDSSGLVWRACEFAGNDSGRSPAGDLPESFYDADGVAAASANGGCKRNFWMRPAPSPT